MNLQNQKSKIFDVFLSKGVIVNKTAKHPKRPFCWSKRFDSECLNLWVDFVKNYRTDGEAWFCLMNNVEPPTCPICNTNLCKFIDHECGGKRRYNTTCEYCSANSLKEKNDKCRETYKSFTRQKRNDITKKTHETLLRNHGDSNYMMYGSDSFQKMMFDKYGDIHYCNHKKAQQTNLKRYGFITNLLIPEIKQKGIEKSLSEESQEKRRNTFLERYNTKSVGECKQFNEKRLETKRKNIEAFCSLNNCVEYRPLKKVYGQGIRFLDIDKITYNGYRFVKTSDISKLEEYKIKKKFNNFESAPENELVDYVKSIYTGKIIRHDIETVSNGNYRFYELDVYLPDKHLAIEFNGVYYHSTKFKDKYYHQRKTQKCRQFGINLLHVYEDDWIKNKDGCLSEIKQCIDGTLQNIIQKNDNIVIADNNKPIFENFRIIKLIEPQLVEYGNNSYYDAGKIEYEVIHD